MTTPWQRITEESYKQWLINRQVVAEEFNQASLVDRSTLRNQFEQAIQQPLLTIGSARQEDQLRKKQKSFATMLDNAQYDMAEKEILTAARKFIGTIPHNSKLHRFPDTIQNTWNREVTANSLKEIRNHVLPRNISKYSPTNRESVAIGLRLGSGFGKTHVLTEAAELLGISSSVYITYNHSQDLTTDTQAAAKATLIRLILASHGCSSILCAQFFAEKRVAEFFLASIKGLEELALFSLRRLADNRDVVVCADEVASLEDQAHQVISVLSRLCHLYYKSTQCICVVMVSSLNAAVFETSSGRPIIDWAPDRASKDTMNFFSEQLNERSRPLFNALSKSICGTHLRSIAICFDEMINGNRPSVQSLFVTMHQRLGVKIVDNTCALIIERVKTCMTDALRDPKKEPKIEELVDGKGALCPAFVQYGFSKNGGESLDTLMELFQTFANVHSDRKALKVVSMHFDRFRATLRVPVVPARAKVCVPHTRNLSSTWYRELGFPDSLEVSTSDLLEIQRQEKGGKIPYPVVVTDTKPTIGIYYHPATEGHPFIDRAYVAVHPSGEKCLVLAQDKVNNDFGAACKGLNQAAGLLSEKWEFTKILLVVNVIGTNSQQTRAQRNLEWPYIMIRSEEEVIDFYSVNFADLVMFARDEHILKISKDHPEGTL